MTTLCSLVLLRISILIRHVPWTLVHVMIVGNSFVDGNVYVPFIDVIDVISTVPIITY